MVIPYTEPTHICWNVTNRCNSDCLFCFRDKNQIDSELAIEDNMRILKNIIDSGRRRITWSGGEALLYNGIDRLIRYASEHGIVNTLITNGKTFFHIQLRKQFLLLMC